MNWKYRFDPPFSCFRQMDMDHPSVFRVALAPDEPIPFQVVDYGGQVAPAFQDLRTYFALCQGPDDTKPPVLQTAMG